MLCINQLGAFTKNKFLIRSCRKFRISIDLLTVESIRILRATTDFPDPATIWYAFLKPRPVLSKNQSKRLALQSTTTERFSDTILSKIPIKLIWFDRKVWHDSVENIDHSSIVISEGVCLAIDAILSAKSTPRLPVSIFVCLPASFFISQFMFAISAYIFCSQQQNLDVSSAYLPACVMSSVKISPLHL